MAYTADSASVPTLAELITAKYIPDMFSKNVIMSVQSKLVVANAVNTEYRSDLRQGYKVNIPLMSEVGISEVVPGTVPTPTNVAGTPTSITVDEWNKASVEIQDMANIQDIVGYLDKAAQGCGYAVAKEVDNDLGALFSTLGGSVYGSANQTLSDDIVLACMEYLDEGDVPDDDRAIICDPSSKVDLLKIDKFVRNDYVRNPVVATGKFGDIYNMRVLITNHLTATGTSHYACMLHRDAIGLVIQREPRSQMVVMPGQFRTLFIVDIIYGQAVLRTTFGKAFYTRLS